MASGSSRTSSLISNKLNNLSEAELAFDCIELISNSLNWVKETADIEIELDRNSRCHRRIHTNDGL